MLAKRIIPCLDVKDGRVVKGVNFVGLRDAGDPVECAIRYDLEGADEITFLDITASHEKRKTMLDVVARTADVVFAPLTVGGGVSSTDHIQLLLRAGADKVSINTAAVREPELVQRAAEAWGTQAIVVAIDARRRPGSGRRAVVGGVHPRRSDSNRSRRGRVGREDGGHGGRRDPAHQHGPRRHARGLRPRADPRGRRPGERPGDRFGGRGRSRAPPRGRGRGGRDAVLAASIFHDGQYTIGEAKAFLADRGVRVRLAGAGPRQSRKAEPRP